MYGEREREREGGKEGESSQIIYHGETTNDLVYQKNMVYQNTISLVYHCQSLVYPTKTRRAQRPDSLALWLRTDGHRTLSKVGWAARMGSWDMTCHILLPCE